MADEERPADFFAAQRLNERLAAIETALVKNGPRVRAQTKLSEGFLAFGKIDRVWRLIYITEKGDEFLLENMSIRIRIEAVHALPALEKTMRKSHQELIEKIEYAVDTADLWLKEKGVKI
jgi:hypothetical protein